MHHSDQSRALRDSQIRQALLTLDKVIRSDPRVVEETASEITTALTRLDGFDDAEPVVLAIREALNNALVHGNRCNPGKTIAISISINCGGSVFASIKDSGPGFDPNTVPNPLAAENLLSNHGRGIFLMRQFMDEVGYKFDHGTEVRMRRKPRWL